METLRWGGPGLDELAALQGLSRGGPSSTQRELARQGGQMESLMWARLGLDQSACDLVRSSKWW